MDTKRIENLSSLINNLKNINTLVYQNNEHYNFINLPYTDDFNTQDIESRIISAMNKAAREVALSYVGKTERKLISVFDEIKRQTEIENFELDSDNPLLDTDSDNPLLETETKVTIKEFKDD
jgi:hypothetical protein